MDEIHLFRIKSKTIITNVFKSVTIIKRSLLSFFFLSVFAFYVLLDINLKCILTDHQEYICHNN